MSKPARCQRPIACFLLVLLSCASLAPQVQAAGLGCLPVVRDGWVRLPPVSMPMLAGFGRIDNACTAAVVIIGASSPAFGRIELHESTVVEGISRMREVPRLRIDAHATRRMEPGGLHLMLLQPGAMPEIGDMLAVEFELSDGRKLQGEFMVRAADAR